MLRYAVISTHQSITFFDGWHGSEIPHPVFIRMTSAMPTDAADQDDPHLQSSSMLFRITEMINMGRNGQQRWAQSILTSILNLDNKLNDNPAENLTLSVCHNSKCISLVTTTNIQKRTLMFSRPSWHICYRRYLLEMGGESALDGELALWVQCVGRNGSGHCLGVHVVA